MHIILRKIHKYVEGMFEISKEYVGRARDLRLEKSKNLQILEIFGTSSYVVYYKINLFPQVLKRDMVLCTISTAHYYEIVFIENKMFSTYTVVLNLCAKFDRLRAA